MNICINGNSEHPKFIFAHGAGAGHDHPFMTQIAEGLAAQGICVIRFDFPYMARQKAMGKKCPPDRAPKLLAAFEDVIASYATESGSVVIGGKSMGGRMASLLSESPCVAGIACLGFPFHAPGKPDKLKGDHLAQMSKPCLILQGERDTFGKKEEVDTMAFSGQVTLHYLPDGDHGFTPRKRSGHTEQENLMLAIDWLAAFIKGVYDEK